MDSDVTQLIERLEAFEERVGVRLEALFAYVHIEYDGLPVLTVNGEVQPREGATLKESMDVHLDAYDSSGKLVEKGGHSINADKFFGFEVFQMRVNLPIGELSKIRVYPTGRGGIVRRRGFARRGGVVRTSPDANATVREFEALVVGIKHHRGHTGGLTPGDLVQLVREPDNIYDPNAVQVKVVAGELLGYIPSELAVTFAKELDAGVCAQARISRIIRKSVYLAVIVGKTELDIQRLVRQKMEMAGQQ